MLALATDARQLITDANQGTRTGQVPIKWKRVNALDEQGPAQIFVGYDMRRRVWAAVDVSGKM